MSVSTISAYAEIKNIPDIKLKINDPLIKPVVSNQLLHDTSNTSIFDGKVIPIPDINNLMVVVA
ncbi:MAG: hypothetical protein KA954_02340 [Chitinophagales bacterium]|nr:hypothetical protein [Chitinophagales bacterium]MBP8753674.1 hypothetical protein [Chitinophagales bacterium]MBP9189176.1 hypothetical protein [Chitinophagales bacterium]